MFMDQKRRESKGIRLNRELGTSVGLMEALIRGQLGFWNKETEIEEDYFLFITRGGNDWILTSILQ